jgi:hypothetical protein
MVIMSGKSVYRQLMAGMVALGVTATGAAAESVAPKTGPEAARALLAKWVETEQIIDRERKDWQQGREMLRSRITLLGQEIASVEAKTKEVREATGKVEADQSEQNAQSGSLREAADGLQGWVRELEGEVRKLYPRLPTPVREKVKPLYDRMPADPEHTEVSLAERYQNVVGILNEANKSNGEITLATEVRTLADGKPAEVRVVYLGLAQAYFVSATGEAGVGWPGEKDWEWKSEPNLAPAVQEVVEVLQNKAKPRFVPLPVKVR